MRRGRRRRRVSLRGWWRALPFIAMAGATFFVFTWLHAQRLQNEYRAIELAAEIDRVHARIAELSGEQYRLGRMERISEKAPTHALVEAKPGQVQIVHAAPEDHKWFEAASHRAPKPARPTRSVVLILEPPAAPQAPSTALAQTNPRGSEASPGNL